MPAEIVHLARGLGLTLRIDGGRLFASPASKLPDDLRDLLIEQKQAIINHLISVPPEGGRLLDGGRRWIPPPVRPGFCPCDEARAWDRRSGLCRTCHTAVYDQKIQMPQWMIDAAGEEQ